MSAEICWFRRDLRVDDNPALSPEGAVGLYVIDPRLVRSAGTHRRRQHLAYLHALDDQLAERGGRLFVRWGDPVVEVARVAVELGASRVRFNADTSPYAMERDAAVMEALEADGIEALPTWGSLVHPPGTVLTAKGTLSRVFTPFHKRWAQTTRRELVPAPERMIDAGVGEGLPPRDGPAALDASSRAVARRLDDFLARADRYDADRDRIDRHGTSGLSVDLRFGTLSPLVAATAAAGVAEGFVRQLAWRDWYAHLLAEVPTLAVEPLRPEYGQIRWRNDRTEFEAWAEGQTGYPLVDAAMRELAARGTMHNRTRMIVASFLVKHLLIDWRWGERHFRRLLLDGEVANNAGNWQWVAGTGPDAAPYFRVFNPISQSRTHDPSGLTIRRWVPELSGLDDRVIHFPADAGPLELAAADVILGETYPEPLVDHAEARERCLAAYQAARA